MPTFKPKNSKNLVLNKRTTTTLDNKHKEITEGFHTDINNTIPILKERKQELKLYIKNNINTINIEDKMNIEDEIKNIKKTIKELKFKVKEYFLKNSQYIFEYFEEKKTICNGNNKTTILDSVKIIFNSIYFFSLDNNLYFKKSLTQNP